MKLCALAAQAVFLPAALAQQAPAPSPADVYRMPAVYSVPGMEKAEIRRDIVYQTVAGEKSPLELKFDLYRPPDGAPGKLVPAVILISGGGAENAPYDWRDGGVFQSYGRILAASGLAGISFSKRYARGPQGTSRGAEDLAGLLRYLASHGAELGVDANRVAFWAFSAGGFLLAPVLAEQPPSARALVCFYCVSEVADGTWDGVAGVTPEGIRSAKEKYSPAELLRRGAGPFPPLFVGRAGLDNPGLNQGIDHLVEAALGKNVFVEVLNHPGGRHGFDILDPDDRSREIVRRALDFLKARLGA